VRAVEDRTPVLVGGGQAVRRDGPVGEPDLEPVALMSEALWAAAQDAAGAGAAALLSRATGLFVIDPLTWAYRDPTVLVADRIGLSAAHRLRTTVGGQLPQQLIGHASELIARGAHDVVLICGAEAGRSVRASARADIPPRWTRQTEQVPEPDRFGGHRDPIHAMERAARLTRPLDYYPLFENALRAAAGRPIGPHVDRIAGLWSRFSQVAATNPYAWSPTEMSAEQLANAGPDNRLINFPYRKLMNANPMVDMGAALIVCSAAAARAARVPTDRWVFPWAAADSTDHWYVGQRWDLGSSPAIAANGRAVLGATGVRIEQVAHVDLYSCFPAAVQVAAAALGLPDDDPHRPLTITGGLTFAGGPGSNYVSHALATLLHRLRAEPSAVGLVTGNGWFLTKHSLGLYSATPPSRPFRRIEPQAEVDNQPRRVIAPDVQGSAVLETYTVLHDSAGAAARAIAATLLPDGRRCWATSTDTATLAALEDQELLGEPVTVRAGQQLQLR
jgi:acetyl-CoA C-acetyltransferase